MLNLFFQGKGIKEIICVAVNDPFVMAAWGENQNAGGKVRMLADTCGELTKALDLELDLAAVLGNMRCKRYVFLIFIDKKNKLFRVLMGFVTWAC